MSLKRLKPTDVDPEQPLSWDMLDAEGKVLFQQGAVMGPEVNLGRLFEQGLYRSLPAPGNTEGDPVTKAQMLLSPGDMLQLQSVSGSVQGERYPVRLIGYHAPVSLLVTAPTLNGKLVFIKEGQGFLVRGFVDRDAVAYSTRVLKSNLSPFAYLHLAWPEEVQTMRIRSSARVPVDLVCAVLTEDGQYAARIKDLSPGGARVVSHKVVGAAGEQIKLAFRINPGGADVYLKPLALIRTVSEADGLVTTGLEFIDLSETESLYLSNMVYQHLLKERP